MKKTTPVSKSIDLWSLGILTYELLTGETPYTYEDNTSELLEEIYNGFISFDEVFPDYVRHFIMNLLQPNPRKRFTL